MAAVQYIFEKSDGQQVIMAPCPMASGGDCTEQLCTNPNLAPRGLKLFRLSDVPAAVRDAGACLQASRGKPPPHNTLKKLVEDGVVWVEGPYDGRLEVGLCKAS